MEKKRAIAALLSALLLVTIFAGCGTQENSKTVTETMAQTEAVVDETAAVQKTESQNIVTVSTLYGDLYYQEQWVEFMKTEQTTEGDSLKVRFAAEFNGMEYALFEIVIGEGEGEPATQITDAEGNKHDVYVNFEEVLEYPELSEDEQNRLYAMQEDINFVVENIK